MKRLKTYLIALFLVVASTTSGILIAEQVYKSTDAQGNVTYSDKAAPSAEPVRVNTAPIGNSQATQQNQQLIQQQQVDEQQKQKAAVENQEAQKVDAEKKRVQELCDNSRSNLSLLQEKGRRVYEIKPDGEYHYFSDEERQQEIDRLEAQIAKYCQ